MELSHPAVVVLIAVAVLLVLELVVLLVLSGGDFGHIRLPTSLFFRACGAPASPGSGAKAQPCLEPSRPPEPPTPSSEPLRLLSLLHRGDGRFLDFVLEDVNAVDDSQIAAAVRAMQSVWKSSLQEHLTF